MHLVVKGDAVARVADIQADEHLELVNKEHIIARVAAGGVLDIRFFVETGTRISASSMASWTGSTS